MKTEMYLFCPRGMGGQPSILRLPLWVIFSEDFLYEYRKLKGLEGHTEVITPGIEANTGSLGMGISKGKGHALAIKRKGLKNKVFVMVGDGELQEGQNWEGLQSAKAFGLGNLVLLLDKNKIQSDKRVDNLLPMPPVDEKLSSFGWKIYHVNGHDISEFISVLSSFDYDDDQPKAVVLDTIKGKGASFMEFSAVTAEKGQLFVWHDKVPSEEQFQPLLQEVKQRIMVLAKDIDIPANFYPKSTIPPEKPKINLAKESVVEGFSKGLMQIAKDNEKVIVLDADLAAPCGLRPFEETYPKRFIQIGIAEQDMVSTAGGLARQGLLPIVNSFASFLTSRANEQIFNNQTEGKKVIYVGHLAGLIPATPGKSHQAVRDIALMRTMPNLVMVEPCNSWEAENMINYLVKEVKEGCYLRLANIQGLGDIDLPKEYKISMGQGAVLKGGKDIALISYGPIILPLLLKAVGILAERGISAKVVNMPWLNKISVEWLEKNILPITSWMVVDNHMYFGGLGEELEALINSNNSLKEVKLLRKGFNKLARTGGIPEILNHYGLNPEALAQKATEFFTKKN